MRKLLIAPLISLLYFALIVLHSANIYYAVQRLNSSLSFAAIIDLWLMPAIEI